LPPPGWLDVIGDPLGVQLANVVGCEELAAAANRVRICDVFSQALAA
jgi:hypothetical protein